MLDTVRSTADPARGSSLPPSPGNLLGEDLEAIRPRTEYLPFGPPLDVICMLSTYSAGGARVPSAFVLTRSVAADAFAVSVTSPPRDKVAHRNHFLAQEMELAGQFVR